MMDVAPPHHTNAVGLQLHLFPNSTYYSLCLIENLTGNNAQYRSAIIWQPHSPDSNQCDFSS